MPQASDHYRSTCQYQRSQISLNIHLKGIHALANLFSVKFYKKRDQNEICRTTLKFGLSMEVTLVTPLWGAASMSSTTASHLRATNTQSYISVFT